MKRYTLRDYSAYNDAELVEDPDGDWVKHEDVKEAIDQAWWDARENETE